MKTLGKWVNIVELTMDTGVREMEAKGGLRSGICIWGMAHRISRTGDVRGRPLGYILVVKGYKERKLRGSLVSRAFSFNSKHTTHEHLRSLKGEAHTIKKANQKNSDKDVSPGAVMVGVLKLLCCENWKPCPSTHSPRVRMAAWETSLDKSYHCFLPLDTCGQIQDCLEKWILTRRDKHPLPTWMRVARHSHTDLGIQTLSYSEYLLF